jgi:hypothetical protein
MTVLHRFKSPQRALPLRDRSPGAVLDILPHRNFRDHQPTGNHRAVMSKRPYPLRSSADRALVTEPRSGGDGTMNTAIATTTTDHDNQTNRPTWRRLALHGVAGCLAATAAVEFYAALGRTAGVAMLAGAPGAHTAQPVTAASLRSVFSSVPSGEPCSRCCWRESPLGPLAPSYWLAPYSPPCRW